MIHWHKLYLYEHKVINQLWGPPHSVIYWHNSIYIFIFEHNVISQLWGPPDLEHPKTLDTTYIYICIYHDLLTQLFLFEHKVINQLRRPPHLEHPRTLQHICIYVWWWWWWWWWWWSIDITRFVWTQSYQPTVETPTLRTSRDITTDTRTHIDICNDLLTQLYFYEPKVVNQLWRPPPLEHPKALQHVYIYNIYF